MEPTRPTHPAVEPVTLGEFGGHVIYAMPTFARVRTPDIRGLVSFFTDVLDFAIVYVGPEIAGQPVLVHLRRAKYQDVLVVADMPTRPVVANAEHDPTLAVTFSAGEADDVDALATMVADRIPSALDGPIDTPWNTRDCTVTDPDGHRWTFTGRGRQPPRASIDQAMAQAADRLGAAADELA